MASQIVHDILPNRSGPQHGHELGEAQGFADQAAIHVSRGQVGALHIGSVVVQCHAYLFRFAKDYARFYADHSPLLALFDQLQVLPPLPWLLAGGRSSASLVGRYGAIHFDQSLPMTAPTIRYQWRRRVRMSTAFELL